MFLLPFSLFLLPFHLFLLPKVSLSFHFISITINTHSYEPQTYSPPQLPAFVYFLPLSSVFPSLFLSLSFPLFHSHWFSLPFLSSGTLKSQMYHDHKCTTIIFPVTDWLFDLWSIGKKNMMTEIVLDADWVMDWLLTQIESLNTLAIECILSFFLEPKVRKSNVWNSLLLAEWIVTKLFQLIHRHH